MVALSKQHGMEMFQKQDPAHLNVMEDVQTLMQNPEAMPEGFDHILLTLGAIVYQDTAKVLGFGFIDSEAQSIESVFVDPDYNGRGIGTIIARELQRLAIEKGLKALSLSASLNAIPFYKSLGFSAGGLSAWRHPSGIELSCVSMSKVM